MGGEPQQNELVDHRVLPENLVTCSLFQQWGWLAYCLSLKQFDEEIVLQFHNMLQDGYANFKGIRIEFIEQVVVEVTGLPIDGEQWIEDMGA